MSLKVGMTVITNKPIAYNTGNILPSGSICNATEVNSDSGYARITYATNGVRYTISAPLSWLRAATVMDVLEVRNEKEA